MRSGALMDCGLTTAAERSPPYNKIMDTAEAVSIILVEEGGFEPPKAKLADLQSVPFGHLGTPPYSVVKVELVDGFEPPTC